MTQEAETPRTDALNQRASDTPDEVCEADYRALARQFERELSAAQAKVEAAEQTLASLALKPGEREDRPKCPPSVPPAGELTVELLNFDDLSEAEQESGLSNNGCGKEYANYIRVRHNGETLFLESDACEPEDKTFRRDLRWIKDALLQCYELGRAAAPSTQERPDAVAEALEKAARTQCEMCREYPDTAYRSARGHWGHKLPDGCGEHYYLPCDADAIRSLSQEKP